MARTRGTIARKTASAGRDHSNSLQQTPVASATPTSFEFTVANANQTSSPKPKLRKPESMTFKAAKSKVNGIATPPTSAHSVARSTPIASPRVSKPKGLGTIVCKMTKDKTNGSEMYLDGEDESEEDAKDSEDEQEAKDNSASEGGDNSDDNGLSDDGNTGTLEDALHALNSLVAKDMEALNKRILQQWRTVTRRYHRREINRSKHPNRVQSQALNGPYAVPLVYWLLLSRNTPVTPK